MRNLTDLRHPCTTADSKCKRINTFSITQEQYDSDEMAKEFSYCFPNQIFTVGQQLAFQFKDKRLLILVVKDIEG